MNIKIYIITCIFLFNMQLQLQAQRTVPAVYPSSTYKLNLVRTREVKKPIIDPATADANTSVTEVTVSSQYYDGLGRPIQTVTKQGSPTLKDIVTAIEYDAYSREQYSYLPFVSNVASTGGGIVNDGKFKPNAFYQQAAFYDAYLAGQGQTFYYGHNVFEASPFNRMVQSYAAGNKWVGTESQGYDVNLGSVDMRHSLNSVGDNVQYWEVTDGPSGVFGSYKASSYLAGQLTKLVTEDEHGGQVIEFKNKQGNVVLRKVLLSAARDMGPTSHGHNGWLNTYYVYDKIGNLRCVIQPKGEQLMWGSNGVLDPLPPAMLTEQCFRYEYDEKNRVIMKQVPGAGATEMVYDNRDRLIMSRDARLTAMGYWNVYKYDEFNRQIKIGLVANTASRSSHQGLADNDNTNVYPTLNSADIMQENYYDNYTWNISGLPTAMNTADYWSAFFNMTPNTAPEYAQALTPDYANVKGKQTGTRVRVLGTSTYLRSVMFYDTDGRLIQTYGTNISGGFDIITTQYNFSGQPIRVMHRHDKSGVNPRIARLLTTFTYDHAGRLLTIKKKAGGSSANERVIVQNQYDELGRLKNKTLGDNLETQTHDYNIRGWLLGANRNYVLGSANNYFGYELAYDNNQCIIPGSTYNNPQYQGNIAGLIWKSKGDGEARSYDFAYDPSNRLNNADFNQFTNGYFNKLAGVDFSTTNLTYDANGNILTMHQKGWKTNNSALIDQLVYTYKPSSNKLAKVADVINDPNSKLGDFKDGTNTGDDYTYDANGNLLTDQNKGITSNILYTHLNMPYQITIPGKGSIAYVYDNFGNKLKKTVVDNTVATPKTTTWTYINGFVYKDDVLEYFTHEEGRARNDGTQTSGEATAFHYDYFLKDHLGNVRMVLTEEQDTDQYPPATIETATRTEEVKYYNIQTAQIKAKSAITPSPTQTSFGNTLYKVHGGLSGQKTGLGIVLKVMAADKVSVRAESYYNMPGGGPGGPLEIALTELLGAFAGSGALAGKGLTATDISGIGTNSNDLNILLSTSPGLTTANAHVNWVLFDDQFKYVTGDVDPVQTDGGYKNHTKFINAPINISRNGYLYIFVSNKSNLEVFFDNLTVTHVKGPMLEETHYYPFGLTMAGISSKAIGKPDNKIKFQGQELASKEFSDGSGLEMYEFKYRLHDAQIGRFIQIDPLSEKYVYNSTYAFSENKVTGHVELEGLESVHFSVADLWRSAGISSSSDPKQFVTNVANETLKPETWVKGAATAGQIAVPGMLVGIMTEGLGVSSVISSETRGVSSRPSLTPATSEMSELNLTGRVSETEGALSLRTQNSATTTETSSGQVNFIVDGSGQAFPVPNGATGPTPIASGKGVQFSGGSGGANGQVATMRIMDPVPARGNAPAYPGGYIKYENAGGQGVNPYTGRTGSKVEVHHPVYPWEFPTVK